MDILSFKQHIENLFKNSEKFSDSDGNLDIPKILESIEKIDIELIKILKDDEKAKKEFFTQIDDIYVLNQNKLIEFFTLNDYMKNGSYTAYSNKIGLIRKDNFIKKFDDIVLAFPHKDCVLEGGQTKDDDKKKEVFYNEILSSDEIDRLFEPKVLTNIKRYSKNGVKENCEIKENDNLIIKGNNLIALHSLKKKFAGCVKLIYIDPPYYFNEKRDSDTFSYNSNFKLSTWLTFMKNRLEIAKEFLNDEGVIFVHIGEDSQAYMEILMNEIFPNNRLGVVSRVQKKGSDKGTFFKPALDYILCYAKDKQYLSGFKVGVDESKFKKIEIEGKRKGEKYEDSKSLYQSSLDPMRGCVNQRYYVECPDGSLVIPKGNIFPDIKKDGNNITPKTQFDGVWRWGVDSYLKQKDLLVFKETPNSPLIDENGNQSKWNVYTKRYLKDAQEKGNIPSNLFDNFTNSTATSTLSSMNIDFSFSKPKELIEHIIKIIQIEDNAIVMDFFAGSGTTAHAVLDINKDLNKNLRFILIEQMDYVENITCERVKKVIKKNEQNDFVYAELKQIDTFKDAEIGALNKNMQYLPISEIEDESYKISKEEIAINKAFYGIENE
ncbi:MAG: DNA methyltransferase [Candidatus Paceibacteria bacterium]